MAPRSCGRGGAETLIGSPPETVIRWHSQGFRAFWNWKSRRGAEPLDHPSTGRFSKLRPATMSFAIPRGGAAHPYESPLQARSQHFTRTVGPLIPRRAKPPRRPVRTFLQNHVADLFLRPTSSWCLRFNVSPFSTLSWSCFITAPRKVVSALQRERLPLPLRGRPAITEAFPHDSASRVLLRDATASTRRDFDTGRKSIGIAEVLTTPLSPWRIPSPER